MVDYDIDLTVFSHLRTMLSVRPLLTLHSINGDTK